MRPLHGLRLRLLLRNGKRYRRGQFYGRRQVDAWYWNGCYFHRRRGGGGRPLGSFTSNWRSGVDRGGQLTLEVGNLALEGSVLPGILFMEVVQLLPQLVVLHNEKERDERGGDR